jgi:nitrite reductase (cytochrome c-552)
VTALIADLEAARRAGRSDAELASARELHRQAQFYLDFIEAENSMGFHAPGEALRILAVSIDLARQGQLALRGVPPTVQSTTAPSPTTPSTTAPGLQGPTSAPAPAPPAAGSGAGRAPIESAGSGTR